MSTNDPRARIYEPGSDRTVCEHFRQYGCDECDVQPCTANPIDTVTIPTALLVAYEKLASYTTRHRPTPNEHAILCDIIAAKESIR